MWKQTLEINVWPPLHSPVNSIFSRAMTKLRSALRPLTTGRDRSKSLWRMEVVPLMSVLRWRRKSFKPTAHFFKIYRKEWSAPWPRRWLSSCSSRVLSFSSKKTSKMSRSLSRLKRTRRRSPKVKRWFKIFKKLMQLTKSKLLRASNRINRLLWTKI